MNRCCLQLATVVILTLNSLLGAEIRTIWGVLAVSAATDPSPAAVADTKFSVDRGFFETPFDVSITCATEGATIVYTTDSSTPSPSHGVRGASPLTVTITTTTVLRAMAYKDPLLSTDVDTQTYLFLGDVIKQSAEISGYPNPWTWLGSDKYDYHDYEMDPYIVEHPDYRDEMIPALLAIPTMSIAVEPADLADKQGFYWGTDDETDTLCSMELIYPDDPNENLQVNAGVVPHSHNRLKRSLRLNFRAEHGDAKLKTSLMQQGSLYGDSATDTFDRLILRGGNNRCWARIWNADKTAYTIDQFYRDSQVELSGYGSRGTFVHLYINGLYWGLYNPVERTDHHFSAEYFGGASDDWFAVHHGSKTNGFSGDETRYRTLLDDIIKKDLAEPDQYARALDYLDVENFSDYMLFTWWMGVGDWPKNNWYGGCRTGSSPLGATPFRFYAWDGEWSWDASRAGGPGYVHPDFRSDESGGSVIPQIWHALRRNDDFLTLFADRVYRHFFNEGSLSEDVAQQRWIRINELLRSAVVAESARWGDAMKNQGQPTRTRDEDWQGEVDTIYDMIQGNSQQFIDHLRQQGYYPGIDPPVFSVDGGAVPMGHELRLTNPNGTGTVYYTQDGSDPRQSGGSPHPNTRIADSSPISLVNSGIVKARVLQGAAWSALHQATFSVGVGDALRISEIMYHPWVGDTEYVELVNIGSAAINLEGVEFTHGLSFRFPGYILAPKTRVVVVQDRDAFAARYGDEPVIVGVYEGTLDNGGERLRLVDLTGQTILDFKYRDSWFNNTDGQGYSLEAVDVFQTVDFSAMSAWQSSGVVGGTPGR
ncbi:chitobiase/beta-hexosaminidase C-terminal domain-containing protein [Planctomycetota bacterium]